ncbi:MAG: DEAD/DEAH box helicase, partial [Proteobacteria bacterium]|nr:DEAD/DEAH box helicase [Pseudomonadota bacterium]
MGTPAYEELESQIDECMLADRFRMRRDLKKKKERDRLWISIRKSVALVDRRKSVLPNVSYPAQLPVSQHVQEIRDALEKHQVLIVAGETGSGKTTQLPKICLEAGRGIYGRIGHTQPRRVAARTIASRLAEELDVQVGRQVGYQVRFQDETGPETLIKVMTDGVLLAETQNDRFLEKYDTLIIDEAHERSLNIDFLLGYVRRILPRRPDLKVIITSATIDVDRFSRHFDNAPIIEVSGRTYPVEVHYRPFDESTEDADEAQMRAIIEVLEEIEALPRGDVLIFLPGEREIRETAGFIRKHFVGQPGRNSSGTDAAVQILPLYSRLAVADQNRVFNPSGEARRIVLATNVAKPSLT